MIKYENDCVGCERCYNCGAKETPHYYCDECGEECDYDEMIEAGEKHYHEDCWYDKLGYKETLTLENAEKYGNINTVTVEINGFYAPYFTEEQINELVKREYLAATSEADIKANVEEMAEWDKQAWMHAVND